MDRTLLGYFFNCGDDGIIQYALTRAHLNRREREVLTLMYDSCMTQEEVAETIGYSVRRTQEFYYSGADKLLKIPWLVSYSKDIKQSFIR